ncbi:MAG: Helix-turn-helix domain protein [Candidatus Scalindua rubra]|uniref:Helix-turn-helix domain protein n=1 Tax=Candidatus Scalindua rubra TaxID=1872076 RepID=A0A1E3XD84_9BACT|nr:MAG: Helix-turn-helix domain protein [Candidatus Scalindua rubra]
MKLEIDESKLIDTIVKKVVDQLKPLIKHDPKSDELMSVQSLADYLKVKKSWVYEKVHTRQIPFRKIGKFPRFPKKHIDLWTINPYHPDLSIYNLNQKERG